MHVPPLSASTALPAVAVLAVKTRNVTTKTAIRCGYERRDSSQPVIGGKDTFITASMCELRPSDSVKVCNKMAASDRNVWYSCNGEVVLQHDKRGRAATARVCPHPAFAFPPSAFARASRRLTVKQK